MGKETHVTDFVVSQSDLHIRMLQMFWGYSLLIGLTRQRITPFFSKNLLSAAMHFAMQWNHLFHSSAQVYFGMSSTALVNAQHVSSALSTRVPFSCFFTSGNRKKLQGERSGKYSGFSSSGTSLSLRKSTVVAAVCVLALSWWKKGHILLSLGGTGTKLWRPSGDKDAHTSLQWLCVCPQEEWWQCGLIFRKNMQPFSSVCCMIFWVFGEGTHSETDKLLTASCLPDHIDRPKFHHLSARPKSILNSLH